MPTRNIAEPEIRVGEILADYAKSGTANATRGFF